MVRPFRPASNHSESDRAAVLTLHRQKYPLMGIANALKFPYSFVQRCVAKEKAGLPQVGPKSCGRPKATSLRDDRRILAFFKRNPKGSTASALRQVPGIPRVHPQTIRNRLRAAGYTSRACACKPMLSEVNKKKRMLWAKQHKGFDFAKVFFGYPPLLTVFLACPRFPYHVHYPRQVIF